MDEESLGHRLEVRASELDQRDCRGVDPDDGGRVRRPSGPSPRSSRRPTTWLFVRTSPSMSGPCRYRRLGHQLVGRRVDQHRRWSRRRSSRRRRRSWRRWWRRCSNRSTTRRRHRADDERADERDRNHQGTHFEGFFGVGWSGRGPSRPGRVWPAGSIRFLAGFPAWLVPPEARHAGWHRASGLWWVRRVGHDLLLGRSTPVVRFAFPKGSQQRLGVPCGNGTRCEERTIDRSSPAPTVRRDRQEDRGRPTRLHRPINAAPEKVWRRG
jgi:hypothetical protein